MGFSYVILQVASHERARLSISTHYEITGDPIAHARLASVIQKSVRWYSVLPSYWPRPGRDLGTDWLSFLFHTPARGTGGVFGVSPGVLPRSWRHSTSKLTRCCLL